MIANPTSKGKTAEAVIAAALVKLGESVLIEAVKTSIRGRPGPRVTSR